MERYRTDSGTALLLIDVINDLSFPGNERLIESVESVGPRIADLKDVFKANNDPVIYVNDNFQKWRSNFQSLLHHCLHDDVPGKELAQLLKPDDEDYFVLKPKHSGFYCTPLDLLLQHLHIKRLVLAGLAGNICVFFTASDAYMRGYKLWIPSDCVASNSIAENEIALNHMKTVLKADISPFATHAHRLSA